MTQVVIAVNSYNHFVSYGRFIFAVVKEMLNVMVAGSITENEDLKTACALSKMNVLVRQLKRIDKKLNYIEQKVMQLRTLIPNNAVHTVHRRKKISS